MVALFEVELVAGTEQGAIAAWNLGLMLCSF